MAFVDELLHAKWRRDKSWALICTLVLERFVKEGVKVSWGSHVTLQKSLTQAAPVHVLLFNHHKKMKQPLQAAALSQQPLSCTLEAAAWPLKALSSGQGDNEGV